MAVVAVLQRFILTSVVMWMAPLVVLWAFNSNILPSISDVTPQTRTLLSGILAVVSVNAVIAVYVWMALRDPPTSAEPNPDPAFAAAAKASMVVTEEQSKSETDSGSKKDD